MKSLIRALAAALAVVSTALAADAPRPNIVFILADDLGPGDIGVLWQNARTSTQKFKTPHLDQFAAEGKILTRHYCPVSVCAPSRASLLLGVHQGHANIRDNEFDDEIENNHTLASVLKQAGYATANIGKWGLAGNNNTLPGHPQNRGFDYFFGYINHGDAHYHYPKETSVGEGVNARVYDGFNLITDQLDKAYSTDFITARSKKWLIDQKTAHPDQPFFLYLAYTAPHARLDLPTQAYPAGGGITGGLQWTGTPGALVNTANGTINSYLHPDYADQNWPEYAKRHATIVRRLDDAVQDVIQTLKDLNVDQNTLIVFTSDNGTHNEAGSGGLYTYNPTYFATYGPYDGIKRDLWEGGIRMPALVRWPAGIAAGTTSAAPSQFQDWLPTFAELAGVKKPERSDGVSILPTLTGQGEQKKGIVYSEYYYAGNTPNYADFETAHRGVARNQMQVVQIGDFKAVRTNIASHEATDFRIYNVATDIKETTDLSGQPGIPTQREFKDLTLRLRRANANAPRPYDNELVPGIPLPGFANGLTWKSYELAAPWVPDLENETPVATGSTTSLDLAVRSREDDVGILYSGYLRVPADGTYQFHLATDTGAFIRIHDAQLLDADFGYTPGADQSSGNIPLKAGFHPVRIYYRHANAAAHQLSLQWSGPGFTLQDVPAGAFFVEAEPQPSSPVASDDFAQTTGSASGEGTPVSIAVLGNDLDADNLPSPLSIVSATTPPNGRAEISGSSIVYTPRPGFFGEDAFSYIVTDGETQTSATVHVSVYAANENLWLPLDETSGSVAYEAGGRPLGTLTGFGATSWTDGKLSGALRFGGATAPKVILTGQKGVTGTHARTIAFWANADVDQGVGIRSTLISWGAPNGSGTANNGKRFDINLNHSTSYRFRAEFNGGGINFNTAAVSDPRGAGWIHVAIVIP
ncbi:MAG: sulfatase, partial [Akkermansiaceae bacterium]|nr:sulfatase [Akkermansiaceae bacterium]